MKNQILELQNLSSELWNEVKALNYNACNKKTTFNRIQKLIFKIKQLDLEGELNLIKEINNIK